jgi:2-oxoisovalerate ferredoxin oxidoreductase beta subunit
MEKPEVKPGQKVFGLDALAIANRIGNAKCANSAVLGALAAILGKYALTSEDAADYEKVFTEAITESFRKKPKVVEQNIAAFNAGRDEMSSQLA